MQLINGLSSIKSYHKECVLTIGNFDGFHLGHQDLISKLKIEGRKRGLPVIVMIFEPQPQEYFFGINAPTRLTWFRDKIKYLDSTGVNFVLRIAFNQYFSQLSPYSFICDLLIKKLGVRFLYVGDDFRFGAGRIGNVKFLKQNSQKYNFKVVNILPYIKNGQRVSSTAVRAALLQDKLSQAEILLGHPYKISGRVIHGKSIGRSIGYPTLNIKLKKQKIPIHGVYVVQVIGIMRCTALPGIANVGYCPTVLVGSQQSLEVHLIDFNIDLYGHYVEVIILTKVRDEKYFNSIKDLKKQIKKDIIFTKKYFRLTLKK